MKHEMPTADSTPLPRLIGSLVRHLSRRRRGQLAVVFVLMILGAFAEVMAIGSILPFLSLAANPEGALGIPVVGPRLAATGLPPRDLLIMAATGFGIMAVLAGVVRLVLVWASQKVSYRMGHDLAVQVFARAIHQPYLHHVSRNSSRLVADVDRVQAVTQQVIVPGMNAAVAVIIAGFILAALVAIDPVVALIAGAGFAGLYGLVSRLTRHRLRANSRIISAAQTERVRVIQEASGAVRDILIDHAQPVYIDRFRRVDLPYRDRQATNAFIGQAPRFVIEGLGMVLFAVIATMLALRPGGMSAALPVLGALAVGAVRLLPLLQQIYNGWASIAGQRQSLVDVVAALELPLPQDAPATAPLPFAATIEMRDVSFRYPSGGGPVLDRISLNVARGSRVGISGRTGSGKSTLMDLLLGLLVPDSGQILIDGVELTAATRAAWQARVAHVPQAIFLADATIAQNIAFGVDAGQIDMARVRRAASQAALADFIETLPQGYDTSVGERGVRLSGGQRQRVGIARALYRNADVLVFDEATSALDSGTEAEVMAAVDALSRELTVFLIAHRVGTLEGCDVRVRLG